MHDFEACLAAAWPPQEWSDVTVLVAVSGGADSVALLRGLSAIRTTGPGRLLVAHFNHHWRGDDSDRDERFVGKLAAQLALPLIVGHAAPSPSAPRNEESARGARLAFLQHAAEEAGARFVVTAHTADDQAETILHRILRGTGLGGLAGIPRCRMLGPATLLRPLLHARRAEVLAYLAALGQDYCSDATNCDPAFTRSRLRHELLPQLAQDFNPDVVPALLRLGRLAGEAQQILATEVAALRQRAVRLTSANQIEVQLAAIEVLPSYLLREMFLAVWRDAGWPEQEMTFDHWESLARLTLTPPGPTQVSCLDLPGGVRARYYATERILRLIRS